MKFKSSLTEAVLLKRHYRFLAEIALQNKRRRMIYCPNLGSLKQCDILGSRIWFSNPLRLSQGCLDIWELTEVNGGWLVAINPSEADTLVREAVELGVIPELSGFQYVQAPIIPRLGNGIELLIKDNGEQCFIHVEPILNGDDRNEASFPTVKGEGMNALNELLVLKENGHRVILIYCIQHNGVCGLRPADRVDPHYGRLLREAIAKGIEVIAYRAFITLEEARLGTRIPILLSENIISG